MPNKYMKIQAEIDAGYEFYQTIIDFDNPIQILREAFQNSIDEDATKVYARVYTDKQLGKEDLLIDIWDNGNGLSPDDVNCFFGLAKSTKVDSNKKPLKDKIGYKGHGTKIFFKSESVEICSRTSNGKIWGAKLEDAVKQIRDNGIFKYSSILDESEISINFPDDFETGFYLRIKNPTYFITLHTRYMLNHLYLRDYSKWFTVFGSISNHFNKNLKERKLFLQGLNINQLKNDFNSVELTDPLPSFVIIDIDGNPVEFEEIKMGHYFPPERKDDKAMTAYQKKLSSNRPFFEYYSKNIYSNRIYLDGGKYFDFIIHVEGYETKRRYDLLLSKRGGSSKHVDKQLLHTDGERYGFWACKGGVPIEKIDDWIIGGRGVGTYTYLHSFVDCSAFELTGTRSSIRNTDLEIIQEIKSKINEKLSEKRIKNALEERQDWEEHEKTIRNVEEDGKELIKRFKKSQNRKSIILPDHVSFLEPSKEKSGYSESETLILLIQLIYNIPNLFPFNILDYNTTKGIDFVIQKGEHPRYIELKGTMKNKVNHSFRNIYKLICYDINLKQDSILTDVEDLPVFLKINKYDKFESPNTKYNGKIFTSFQLVSQSTVIQSMEILVLKNLLIEILNAKIQ